MLPIVDRLAARLAKAVVTRINAQRTLAIQLDITNACNLSCAHCYHANHENRGALALTGWLGVLDQYEKLLARLHLTPSIIFCGGEPQLSPHLIPLLDEVDRRFPRSPVAVLTNGTILKPSFISRAAARGVAVQISLDGPDSERHNVVRGVGSFERALDAVRKLVAAGVSVTLQCVLSRRTAPFIDAMFDLAQRSGADRMAFARFIGVGAGAALAAAGGDGPLEALALRDAMEKILAASERTGIATNTDAPLYNLLDPSIGHNGRFGFQGLIVDYLGRLKVSSRADVVLGDVQKDGLAKLFLEHPLMRDLRAGRIRTCGSCKHYTRCGGDRNAAYAAYGDIRAPDPGCWIIPKEGGKTE